jgi:signal transduction histidine kinase
LIGMRERVALFGGELHAGRNPAGGFSVHARLPLDITGPSDPNIPSPVYGGGQGGG